MGPTWVLLAPDGPHVEPCYQGYFINGSKITWWNSECKSWIRDLRKKLKVFYDWPTNVFNAGESVGHICIKPGLIVYDPMNFAIPDITIVNRPYIIPYLNSAFTRGINSMDCFSLWHFCGFNNLVIIVYEAIVLAHTTIKPGTNWFKNISRK